MIVAAALAGTFVVAFVLGRLSAARTIRHTREALDWRIRLGEPHVERPRRFRRRPPRGPLP